MITHSDDADKDLSEGYAPFCLRPTWRQVDPPIQYGGKVRSRYRYNAVEYVDLTTGEILSDKEMCKQAGMQPPIHFSERCLQRRAMLDRLRPEPREFATFMLRFRNQRRGITPGIQELCGWYATMIGKQAGHVRRYVPKLLEAEVLEGGSLVGAPFQFSGKQTSAADHKHEEAIASCKYLTLVVRGYGQVKLRNLEPRRARDSILKAAA